jgi:hypothetical protein
MMQLRDITFIGWWFSLARSTVENNAMQSNLSTFLKIVDLIFMVSMYVVLLEEMDLILILGMMGFNAFHTRRFCIEVR